MDPYKAGQELGSAIFGGGAPGTYEKQVRAVGQAETAIQQARRARSQALIDAARLDARQAITADLVQRAMAGDLAAQGELGASTLGSNSTVSLTQLGDFQQPRFGEVSNIRADALGLGEDPVDIPLANRAGAFLSGKDYQPIRAEGGAYVADGATLGDLDVVPTPSTLSMIEARERSADRADRRATAPRASTAKPERFTAPSQGSLKNAFAKGKGLDQERYNLFLRWRQDNPELMNGEQALQQFLSDADVFTIDETGNWRPNSKRYRPPADDGIPVVDNGRGLGDVVAGETFYQAPDGQQRNTRITQVEGRPVVSVSTPEEAKAAWAKLQPGAGLKLPNGTIRWK